MEWLNSSALWWLLALLIPLAIHLLSKKRQKVTRIGSIRFIPPAETMSSRSIYFTQWLLFIIRCLLIICLILILAQLFFKTETVDRIVYIEDKVHDILIEEDKIAQNLNISDDYITFSISGVHDPPKQFINYWSLINYLNDQPGEAVIYAENSLKGFKGTPQTLDTRHKWIMTPRKNPIEIRDTINGKDESFHINYKISEELMTYHLSERESSRSSDTIRIKVHASAESKDKIETFSKIISALNNYLPWVIMTSYNSDPDWVINIDTSTLDNGSNVINYHNENGPLILNQVYNKNYKLSGHLNLKNLANSDFPDQWSSEIISHHLNLTNHDYRQISHLPFHSDVEVNSQNRETYRAGGQPFTTPLWWLFFMLIWAERILSVKSRA